MAVGSKQNGKREDVESCNGETGRRWGSTVPHRGASSRALKTTAAYQASGK